MRSSHYCHPWNVWSERKPNPVTLRWLTVLVLKITICTGSGGCLATKLNMIKCPSFFFCPLVPILFSDEAIGHAQKIWEWEEALLLMALCMRTRPQIPNAIQNMLHVCHPGYSAFWSHLLIPKAIQAVCSWPREQRSLPLSLLAHISLQNQLLSWIGLDAISNSWIMIMVASQRSSM